MTRVLILSGRGYVTRRRFVTTAMRRSSRSGGFTVDAVDATFQAGSLPRTQFWGPLRASCPDRYATPPVSWVEVSGRATGADLVEQAGDQSQVHPAHNVGCLLCERAERAIGQDVPFAVGAGREPVGVEHVHSGS